MKCAKRANLVAWILVRMALEGQFVVGLLYFGRVCIRTDSEELKVARLVRHPGSVATPAIITNYIVFGVLEEIHPARPPRWTHRLKMPPKNFFWPSQSLDWHQRRIRRIQ
jgi:hypothetical protein